MPSTVRGNATDEYMELIGELPLRRIRTAAVHARAKRLILRLSTRGAGRGTEDYVDVLIDLVADYEARAVRAFDASMLSAAQIVRHRMGERGLSVSALARAIEVPQSNLSEMLSGRRDWSKAAIRGLAAYFDIRADRFLV